MGAIANHKKLFTVKEASIYFDIKENTLRKWIYEKHIKVIRINKRSLRIPLEEIEALLVEIQTIDDMVRETINGKVI